MRPANLRTLLKILVPGSVHLTHLTCQIRLQCNRCQTQWTTEANAQGLLACG